MAEISNPTNHTKGQPGKDLGAVFDIKPIPSRKRNRAAKADAPCHVYLMENRATGMVKVGYTLDLAKRIVQVTETSGTQPGERAYWGWVTVDRAYASKLEAALHREWAEARGDGEWFDLRGRPVMADVHRVAGAVCASSFKVFGLSEDGEKSEERWSSLQAATYRPGGIAGPRIS